MSEIEGAVEFDLTDLDLQAVRSRLGQRLQNWISAGLGVGLVGSAVYLGVVHTNASNSLTPAEAGALILAGTALVVSGWWYYPTVYRLPDRLIISPKGLVCSFRGKSKRIEIPWTSHDRRLSAMELP